MKVPDIDPDVTSSTRRTLNYSLLLLSLGISARLSRRPVAGRAKVSLGAAGVALVFAVSAIRLVWDVL